MDFSHIVDESMKSYDHFGILEVMNKVRKPISYLRGLLAKLLSEMMM